MRNQIPEVVILRLPLYARSLALLTEAGTEIVSSQELAERLGVSSAQIRKDLSYFGRFGKQGKGYNVKRLLGELRQILGLDQQWSMALVGVGRLGRAILNYEGFATQGFTVVAAFDISPRQKGTKIGDLEVQDLAELKATVKERNIDIGIVAVPASRAQEVINLLVACDIKAILNYTPIVAQVPPFVLVRDINPVLSLESMTFYLKK